MIVNRGIAAVRGRMESEIVKTKADIVDAEQNTVWSKEYKVKWIGQLQKHVANAELELRNFDELVKIP